MKSKPLIMSVHNKEALHLGMPWEKDYGYAQAVKSGNTVWLAGQLGHDSNGTLLAGMENQMRQAYANIKQLLTQFHMNMDDVVEEVLYVLDMRTAFEARKMMGADVYQHPMDVASTVIVVSGLALPDQLIEIKIVAKK